MGNRHISKAVSQAYTLVILPSIGELHAELMTLTVQHLWFESQLIPEMKLLQNFGQGACVSLGRCVQILAAGMRDELAGVYWE